MGFFKQANRRRLRLESLESRQLMAGDVGHNFLTPHDVNDDSRVTPLDALTVINFLNNDDQGNDPRDDSTGRQRMVDVNDDSQVSPLDALQVVNVLNRSQDASGVDLSGGQVHEAYFNGDAGQRAKIEFEREDGEAELSIRLRDAAGNTSYGVFLNDWALGELMVDSRGRGELKLGQSDDRDGRGDLPAGFSGLMPGDHFRIEGIIDALIPTGSGIEHSIGDDSRSSDGSRSSDISEHAENEDDEDRVNSSQLVASFVQTAGLHPEAEFEIDSRRGVAVRKFEVEVERGTPGQSLPVSVDGIVVGTLTPNSRGKAKLKLSSAPRDADEMLMPNNFPTVTETSVIRIGGAEGFFRRVARND